MPPSCEPLPPTLAQRVNATRPIDEVTEQVAQAIVARLPRTERGT